MDVRAFLEFVRLVIRGDVGGASRRLGATPELATMALPAGAKESFLTEIRHQMYRGDTALHLAAAASCPAMVELLISHRADCRATNRRGAAPLHYASDGHRPAPNWQAAVIEYLISMGAEPNVVDKSGVAPLHRAVRARSVAAVRALLDGGAAPRQPNRSGSTPLHLAVQNTGKSGSGSDAAHRRQREIIQLLLARGAKPTDQDLRGRTVEQAATSAWIRDLLT